LRIQIKDNIRDLLHKAPVSVFRFCQRCLTGLNFVFQLPLSRSVSHHPFEAQQFSLTIEPRVAANTDMLLQAFGITNTQFLVPDCAGSSFHKCLGNCYIFRNNEVPQAFSDDLSTRASKQLFSLRVDKGELTQRIERENEVGKLVNKLLITLMRCVDHFLHAMGAGHIQYQNSGANNPARIVLDWDGRSMQKSLPTALIQTFKLILSPRASTERLFNRTLFADLFLAAQVSIEFSAFQMSETILKHVVCICHCLVRIHLHEHQTGRVQPIAH